ncbi:MAG: hypothetical protein PUB52_10270 [Lachnospiraceae bacterium]|nr:hypothetical protein [Lachnospiraceae bacterium]
MKKIAFVVVWMGSLPNYFPLWLSSCGVNNTVDFFLFTDDSHPYDVPSNVKMIYKSFDEVRGMIQKHFDFPISLERAYKLCDYKPTYGEVFRDYLVDYDFWGYCDLDLIWGDIRRFVTDEILEQNERIFTRGHCSLFRNNEKVNAYYRTLSPNGHLDYKMVYQSPESWCFDEWAGHCGGGISIIFREHDIKTYDDVVMADITVGYGSFYVNRRPELGKVKCFLYYDGKVFARIKSGIEEVLYCHFQKRTLHIKISSEDYQRYSLVPIGRVLRFGKRDLSLVNLLIRLWLDCKRFLRRIIVTK